MLTEKYTDIMLDIETFGTGTNAAIVQIGAVAFNADGDYLELFHNSPDALATKGVGLRMNVDLTNSLHPGVISPSTVEWWLKQSDEARGSILSSGPNERVPLGEALEMFAEWVGMVSTGRNNVRLWSNGPTFDEMIVRQAFERYSMDFHKVISFRQSRCCRTMFDLATGFGWDAKAAMESSTTLDGILKHDGLSDSVFQARCLVLQREFLRGRLVQPVQ